MIKFIVKLAILGVVVVAVSASGLTFNVDAIENETLRTMASAWNFMSAKINQFVAENDEEIIEFSKAAVNGAANITVDALAFFVEYVKERNATI